MGTPMKSLEGQLVTLLPIDVLRDAPEWFEAMKEPNMHIWENCYSDKRTAENNDWRERVIVFPVVVVKGEGKTAEELYACWHCLRSSLTTSKVFRLCWCAKCNG